jgi:hypothetical protein
MRYYEIVITSPAGTSNQPAVTKRFSSLNPDGTTNLGALQIEFDFPVWAMAEPAGTAFLRVWGISIVDISQARNYNGSKIQVYAGMAAGLPLANPAYRGLIMEGTVQQAFGNWQETNQCLDFVIQPYVGAQDAPANIVLDWKAGTQLAAALAQTLTAAFPGYQAPVINISPNLVLPADEVAYFQTATQLAQYLKQVTQALIQGNYPGVDMVIRNNQVVVYDGTSRGKPQQLKFIDLIGQPTWLDFGTIQFKCAVRADLNVNDYVTMPPSPIVVTAQTYSQYKNQATFRSTFQVIRVRHVGNYRQRDASAWVTIFDAVQLPEGS